MADHSVKFTVPYRDLGRSDVKFKIYGKERRKDTQLIGTLYVSHGALEWRSRKKHNIVKLAWDDFDRYMQQKRNGK
jgi:hypothetical protein